MRAWQNGAPSNITIYIVIQIKTRLLRQGRGEGMVRLVLNSRAVLEGRAEKAQRRNEGIVCKKGLRETPSITLQFHT